MLGKPAGSDEAQEKNTFPKLLGLEASKVEAERLLSEAIAHLHASDLATPALLELVTRAVRRSF